MARTRSEQQFSPGIGSGDPTGTIGNKGRSWRILWAPTHGFEGSTSDDFETLLQAIDPTADNTLLLPNTSGTLMSAIDASAFNDFDDAITAAIGGTLLISTEIAITTDTTIPTTVFVHVVPGGSFAVSAGKTLTMPEPKAGRYQIYSGAGVVKFQSIFKSKPEWWGAVGDKATDDGPAFQLAFNANPWMDLDGKDYRINSRVYLDSAVSALTYRITGTGHGSILSLGAGLDGTYAFTLNQAEGGSTPIMFNRHPRLVVDSLQVDGTAATNASFIYYNQASFQFKNLLFEGLLYGANGTGYSDSVLLDTVHWVFPVAGGFCYRNPWAGDGLVINQLFTLGLDAVYLKNCHGAKINACIGGNYTFVNCSGIVVNSGHFEFADANHIFTIKNSHVTFDENHMRNDDATYRPFYIDDDDAVELASNITIENIVFEINEEDSSVGNNEIEINNLKTTSKVELLNNIRRVFVRDNTDFIPYIFNDFGIRAISAIGGLNTELINWRQYLSGQVEIKYVKAAWRLFFPSGSSTVDIHALNDATIDSVAENTDQTAFTFPANTYYYRAVLIGDLSRATLKSAESSVVKASGTSVVKLTLTAEPNTMLYLYRGTAADTYDTRFRIPIISGVVTLYDKGTVAAGVFNDTPGPYTPSAANETFEGTYDVISGRRVVFSTAAPTVGTWKVGDITWDTNAAAAATPGWYCTTAGTPGTWKAMAVLSA